MTKSTIVGMLAFLAAAVGALTACALYLRRREKELDEYEKLLFSEDYDPDAAEEDEDEEPDGLEYADIPVDAAPADAPAAPDSEEE